MSVGPDHAQIDVVEEPLPPFLAAPEPITDVVASHDYDVVVIGAGTPGVPCALAAHEAGASVAVLQKESAADVEALVSLLVEHNAYRSRRERIETWAHRSGEALTWLKDRLEKAGAQVSDLGTQAQGELLDQHPLNLEFITTFLGPNPYGAGDAMRALAAYAADQGVDFFYDSPAVQLVQDDSGWVTGVIAKTAEGHVQFNGRRGVVVGTGDYQNDADRVAHYVPDVKFLERKKHGRTGDGHEMITWAGGRIENLGHTKMCHDVDSGPGAMVNTPFLRVKLDGTRFVDESVGMEYMNCFLGSPEDSGHYCQIFDAEYETAGKDLPGDVVPLEKMRPSMPEEDVEREGVLEHLIATWRADTLQELAAKLQIRDVDAFLATVARCNELADAGEDTDFGTPGEHLTPIRTAPFYGIHRPVRLTQVCSGVEVNADLQCLRADGTPIEGLYAIGNTAGNFYGSADYPLNVGGLNLGHNDTEGYVVGRALADAS